MKQLHRLVNSTYALFPLIKCGGDPCDLSDAEQLILAVLQYMWAFAGTAAVLVVLWGAFQFMTAAGDTARAESARKTIWAGIIGAIIVVAAYAATRLYANTVFGEPIPLPPPLNPGL